MDNAHLRPDVLADALQDRIGPTSGKLLTAKPIIPMGATHAPRIPADADLTDFKRLLRQGKIDQAIHLIESGLVQKDKASTEIELYLRKIYIDNEILGIACIAILIIGTLFTSALMLFA